MCDVSSVRGGGGTIIPLGVRMHAAPAWRSNGLCIQLQDMAEVAPPEAPAPQLKNVREQHPGAMMGDTQQVSPARQL